MGARSAPRKFFPGGGGLQHARGFFLPRTRKMEQPPPSLWSLWNPAFWLPTPCKGCSARSVREGAGMISKHQVRLAPQRALGRTDGRTDGRTGGRAGGRTDGRAGGRTDGRTDGRAGGGAGWGGLFFFLHFLLRVGQTTPRSLAFVSRCEPPRTHAPGAQMIRVGSGTSGWQKRDFASLTLVENATVELGPTSRCYPLTEGTPP
eukprot:gene22574-biopygen10265